MTPGPLFLMECPLAGLRFHEGQAHWAGLAAHDRVQLRREPGNRHDARAIAVEWRGVMLGYVPREANFAVSQMLDRGARVEARIARLQPGASPWKRVSLELFAHVDAPSRQSPPLRPSNHSCSIQVDVPSGAPPQPKPAPLRMVGEHADCAMRILVAARDEIARRLALPVKATDGDTGRSALLWNTLQVCVDAAGHGLRATFPDAAKFSVPITADLSSPLGPHRWTLAFIPYLAGLCAELQIPRELLKGPVGRWLHASLQLTFRDYIDFAMLRRSVLELLAPDALALSLANRIFDRPVDAAQFNWVAMRTRTVALAGVERPRMLPFLRYLERAGGAGANQDPMNALRAHFDELGIAPAAWQRLEEWGFETFASFDPGYGEHEQYFKSAHAIVDYANLLHALEVKDPPPALFGHLAARAAALEIVDDSTADPLEVYPTWFMRALLRAIPGEPDDDDLDRLKEQLDDAIDWIFSCDPEPDANQCKAGWRWIVVQARDYLALRDSEQWPVPPTIAVGHVRCVSIGCGAELRTEAKAMSNCLENYHDACAASTRIVLSMRDARTGKRLASFMVQRHDPSRRDGPWTLTEIKGRFNAAVDDELVALAWAAIAVLNARPQ